MLSKQDNDVLTRVGPGTPMGALLRQYWHPVLYSYELSQPDAPPVRVRLLCEDLLVFRDSGGQIGLIEENCPHRGASLFFGRNEECGIRCVYHGWKFDVNGKCVDMPNEPAETNFAHKVSVRAYPCKEWGGIIWAFLGDGEPPNLPELEWARVSDNHKFMTKRYHQCNWAQALEGDLDSSHVGFLHSELDRQVPAFGHDQPKDGDYKALGHNQSPRLEVEETEFGMWVVARRPSTKEHHFYWRATALLFPYFVMIPPSGDAPIHVNLWQPMDDENTLVWSIQYHGGRPLTHKECEDLKSGLYEHFGPDDTLPPTSDAGGAWRSRANRGNDFLIDRKAQMTNSYTGLRGFWRQDRAVTESMGSICNRTKEHLGASDTGIIRFRRMFLKAARDFAHNGSLPTSRDPAASRIRPIGAILPEQMSWRENIAELSAAHPERWRPGD